MPKIIRSLAILAWLLLASLTPSPAAADPEPRMAPRWDVAEWLNPPGPTLAELRGKVVVLDFFQLWCPGCNRFSIPLMKHWQEKVFAREIRSGQLAFVSIHSVFEGHAYQSPRRLRRFVKQKGIAHPVGIDRHSPGQRVPETMLRYNVMGTPEMVFIDKQGKIRFQHFGFFEPKQGELLIRELLAEGKRDDISTQ
ncbi:MAG: TlpA family protein disulfide reductase [Alphaproteobacteria bacterium]|nr:MAG: TlpA family protein disulfide reductase [Alphaproteobacteria bacterium]